MQSSISVKLFGEQERDQNKRNNKRPLPAWPFLYGTRCWPQRPLGASSVLQTAQIQLCSLSGL